MKTYTPNQYLVIT